MAGQVRRIVDTVRPDALVVADPRLKDSVGVQTGVASYPTRRDFLRRVRVGPQECTLEWLCPVRLEVAPGAPLELRLAVAHDPPEHLSGEVLRTQLETRLAGSLVVVRTTGLARATLASVYARASGQPPEQGFRAAPRLPLEVRARYAAGHLSGRGELLDLSRRGARLHTRGWLPPLGTALTLELRTGFFRRDALVARVAWTAPERRCFGVEFMDVTPDVQQRLLRLR